MDRSHRVDISGLLAGSRQLMRVADEVPIEPFEGIVFPEPARVELELRQADRMLAVQGSVDARVHGQCDACLDDVDMQIHVDLDERFDPTHGREVEPFGESNVLAGERLDVADLAQQSIVTTLPMGLRCRADCKGLCAVCGANRNTGECTCNGVTDYRNGE
ncbi:MAG TPA: DUF177 domain-containing protein [Candidatus Cybelea sp.]|jgi:uncharacterized protein|nr:DUF177 domain-containing protein [Candidatus Cybelea sp.]